MLKYNMHEISENHKRFMTFLLANRCIYPKYIEDLRAYAKSTDVPIIEDITRDYLVSLLKLKKPKNILELGTAIAYSALIMADFTNKTCKIDTVENYERRIIEAKKNIKIYDKFKKIKLYEEDITLFLNNNKKKYDFVFLDAEKAQYIVWLPKIIESMKKGALLVTDNILRDGDILESRYSIRKRDRTIHKRMREFIYKIFHTDNLSSFMFDIGDGVSLSINK